MWSESVEEGEVSKWGKQSVFFESLGQPLVFALLPNKPGPSSDICFISSVWMCCCGWHFVWPHTDVTAGGTWDTSSHLRHKPLHQQPVNWTGTMKTMAAGRSEPRRTVPLRLLGPCCHMYRSCGLPDNKSLAMRQDAPSFIPLTLSPAPWNLLGTDLWPLASSQTKQADTPPLWQPRLSTVDLLSTAGWRRTSNTMTSWCPVWSQKCIQVNTSL